MVSAHLGLVMPSGRPAPIETEQELEYILGRRRVGKGDVDIEKRWNTVGGLGASVGQCTSPIKNN